MFIKDLVSSFRAKKDSSTSNAPLPSEPFGSSPWATSEEYLYLYNRVAAEIYPEVNEIEHDLGFAIPKSYLNQLALHTQVVVKKSALCYQHGRLLYSYLRQYLHSRKNSTEPVNILETGTARGFSAVCMAKALIDSGTDGRILSIDCISHNDRIYWNCIDDLAGPQSRQQLLSPWKCELSRIIFIQAWATEQLAKTGLSRINFAFLDAQHEEENVLEEYAYVSNRQESGDIIFFDDCTDDLFPGVVAAVEKIESHGLYEIRRIIVSPERKYAIGVRN